MAGDEVGGATIAATYTLSWQPILIDLQQKTNQDEAELPYHLRKFYDGRGRLIQQQTARAMLADNACSTDAGTDPDECDIVVDTWVSGDGLEQRQSVPYALSYWYSGKPNETVPYRGQRIEPGEANPVPYTTTSLDLLGRAVQVTAPDGTHNADDLRHPDGCRRPVPARPASRMQRTTPPARARDSRGRTVEVDPPEGPGVAYTYDAADRLKTANMGGAETELWYDYAGRKTKMDDADMGLWSYGYNALNQLINQSDARGCITNLSYDLAGRLSSKSYNLSGCTNVAATSHGHEHLRRHPALAAVRQLAQHSNWTKLGNVTVTDGKLKLTGNGAWGTTYAVHTANLADGQAARFSFKTDDAALDGFISLDRGSWNNSDYRSWTLRMTGGYLKREYKQGTSAAVVTTLMALKANTWYEGVLAIDGTAPASSSESYTPRFRVVVWERDNPGVYAQDRVSPTGVWSYSDWKFVAQAYTNTKSLYLDYEQEYDDGAIGQRSKLTDGSGSTEWQYTSRGQVQSEKKTIGSDIFLTQYGYHPDGSVRWMTYPGGNTSEAGEKVEFAYLPQKALEVCPEQHQQLLLPAERHLRCGR